MRILRALRRVGTRFRGLSRTDKLRLFAWLMVVGALGSIGSGVGNRLHETDITPPHTPAARAAMIHDKAFGRGQDLVIRLQGPPAVLRREGPTVASQIAALPNFHVLDPWHTRWRALQPTPDQALLMLWVSGGLERVSAHSVPLLRKRLLAVVKPPLNAQFTGYADMANALQSETIDAIKHSEMIALPALLVVLILVLGSPIAALLPLLLGGLAIGAGTGLLALINDHTPLDVSALSLTSMLGLALGVDYSMLMVSRFRRELAEGATVSDAASTAARRGGKTVRFAAVILALAMAGLLAVMPAGILRSEAVGALVAVAVGVLGALVVLPPMLRWVGHSVNRLQIVHPLAQSGRWTAAASKVMRHPVVAAGAVLVVLLAIASPTLEMKTGPALGGTLPRSSQARRDLEIIRAKLGESLSAPFLVTAVARNGTLTGSRRWHALVQFQRKVESDPGTLFVIDPGSVRARTLPTAPPAQRTAAAAVTNLTSGSTAAQFVIFQRTVTTHANDPYRRYLEQSAAQLGRQTNSTAVVGGPATSIADFDKTVKDRLWLLIGVLAAITFMGLVVFLRSLVLPLLAVTLNMLTVLAAFGVLAVGFGPSHPLGGPGYVDDIMVVTVLSVTFALSIDYTIFVLDRMREGHKRTGSLEGAIAFGVDHTAGVVTGAAAIMAAVFLAFASSEMTTLRELGVGLTMAVVLDATLIRIVLLPAAIRLARPRIWRRPSPATAVAPAPEAVPAGALVAEAGPRT
jgi:putative drug exporter of the RND superfamily